MSTVQKQAEITRLRAEGKQAALESKSRQTCPYKYMDALQWAHGYNEGEQELLMHVKQYRSLAERESISLDDYDDIQWLWEWAQQAQNNIQLKDDALRVCAEAFKNCKGNHGGAAAIVAIALGE